MHLNGRPVASFDPEGLIFAAGIDSRQLKLYDLRTFDKVCAALVSKTRTFVLCAADSFSGLCSYLFAGPLCNVPGATGLRQLRVDWPQVQQRREEDLDLDQHQSDPTTRRIPGPRVVHSRSEHMPHV